MDPDRRGISGRVWSRQGRGLGREGVQAGAGKWSRHRGGFQAEEGFRQRRGPGWGGLPSKGKVQLGEGSKQGKGPRTGWEGVKTGESSGLGRGSSSVGAQQA